MKQNFLLNVGLNDQYLKQQVYTNIDHYINTVGNFAPNCTITPCIGFYKGMRENSLKIEVYDITEVEANNLANTLKESFNQECVALTNLTVNKTVFI